MLPPKPNLKIPKKLKLEFKNYRCTRCHGLAIRTHRPRACPHCGYYGTMREQE